MKLMTNTLEKKFPKLYETDGQPAEKTMVVAKYFNPCGVGTWFAVEYDPEDRIFFGYVNLGNDDLAELGYFSLDELESLKLPFGLRVERDLYFGEHSLAEVIQKKGNL